MINKRIPIIRIFCYLLLFLLPGNIFAQHIKTVYYDKYWKETNYNADVVYYRKIQKIKDSTKLKLFLVKDYYKNNDTLQMQGLFIDPDKDIKHGKFTYYFPNGKIESEGYYSIDRKEGEFKEYYESGQLQHVAAYHNDTITSLKKWHEDNSVSEIATYKNGKLDGKFFSFYPNGKLIRFDVYNEGIFMSGKCYTSTGTDTTYYPHVIKPVFPHGFDKFIEYVRRGIQARNVSCGWFYGNIYLTATVDTSGKIIDPHLLYTTDRCYLENLYELLEKSPAWTPAKIDGITEQYRIGFAIYFPNEQSGEIELLDLN